eukprot:g15325.t1
MSDGPHPKRQRVSPGDCGDACEKTGCDLLKAAEARNAPATKDARLPVTVLSGFLGSGKTTTLTHLLNNSDGVRIALIVNDMASLNVDALQVTNEMARDQLLKLKADAKKNKSAGKSAAGENGASKGEAARTPAAAIAEPPKMVALQNGCICCTLREDLVEQVAELANGNKYDYLIIESTGISEPVPVAQTFCHSLEELAQMAKGHHIHEQTEGREAEEVGRAPGEGEHEKGDGARAEKAAAKGDADEKAAGSAEGNQGSVGETDAHDAQAEHTRKLAVQAIELQKIARLDTMVTVVDACEVWEVLSCLETIGNSKWSKPETSDENGKPKQEGLQLDRNIADLLVDQIEFANVILLNKRDLLLAKAQAEAAAGSLADDDAAVVEKLQQRHTALLEGLVRKLNPGAKVYWTDHGKICPKKVLGTSLFDFEAAQKSAGWQQELANDGHHTPETEEYGISSVVFRSNQPFHPERLHAILTGLGKIADHVEKNACTSPGHREKVESESEKQVFKGVIRSKGHLWLANCCGYRMDWHSVGRQFSMKRGDPFDSAVREADVEPSAARRPAANNGDDVEGEGKKIFTAAELAALTGDELFSTAFGDRKNELVVIGVQLDKERINRELEAALVSVAETEQAAREKIRFESFLAETREKGGDEALIALTEKKVKKATGGNATPWDRFLKLEDAFFGGKAQEEYMEYVEEEEGDADDDMDVDEDAEDDEEESNADEETDVGSEVEEVAGMEKQK